MLTGADNCPFLLKWKTHKLAALEDKSWEINASFHNTTSHSDLAG